MKLITASIAMGGGGDTTTKTEPPEFLKPYLQEAARGASLEFNAGQRDLPPDQSSIAPVNDIQRQAQQLMLNYATGGVNTPQQPNYSSPIFSNFDMAVAAPTSPNTNNNLPPGIAPVQGMGYGITPAVGSGVTGTPARVNNPEVAEIVGPDGQVIVADTTGGGSIPGTSNVVRGGISDSALINSPQLGVPLDQLGNLQGLSLFGGFGS